MGDNIFNAIHLIALRNNGLTNMCKDIIKPSRKCEADKRVADKVLKRKNNTPQQPGQQRGQKAQPQRQKRFKHVSNATWQRGIRIHRSNTAISIRCRAISMCLNSSSMVSGLGSSNSSHSTSSSTGRRGKNKMLRRDTRREARIFRRRDPDFRPGKSSNSQYS